MAKSSRMIHSCRANASSVCTLDGKGADAAVCKKKNTAETGCIWALIITTAGAQRAISLWEVIIITHDILLWFIDLKDCWFLCEFDDYIVPETLVSLKYYWSISNISPLFQRSNKWNIPYFLILHLRIISKTNGCVRINGPLSILVTFRLYFTRLDQFLFQNVHLNLLYLNVLIVKT